MHFRASRFQNFLGKHAPRLPLRLFISACEPSVSCLLKKTLAKRSQHFSTTYPNIDSSAFASSGQTITTFECNTSQHCWVRHVARAWLPCCHMLDIENQTSSHARVQHCCMNLTTRLQHPQMLHEKSDHFQIQVNNTQRVATSRSSVAKRTNKCCDR